jgi:transposase
MHDITDRGFTAAGKIVDIITGPERRRSWKRAIVAAAFAPEAIVADVARRAAVCAGQIYRWRQELGHPGSGFSQVVITAMADGGNDRAALDPAPAIEVEFGGAARVRIAASTPPELAAAVVRALHR